MKNGRIFESKFRSNFQKSSLKFRRKNTNFRVQRFEKMNQFLNQKFCKKNNTPGLTRHFVAINATVLVSR